MWRRDAGNYVDMISTALLLDSNIRNSVCTPAKLPCRRVVEGYYILIPNKIPSSHLFSSDDVIYIFFNGNLFLLLILIALLIV
jgi:hypothetical protein